MAKGFDCATPLTAETAAAFAADGYEFVCRYFPVGYAKSLTLAEAKTTSGAGLNIASVFERYANRALEGYGAGVLDGESAERSAAGVQQPHGSTIYFAVDFDVTNAEQMAAVVDYIRGCSEATPNYTTGGYGEKEVIDALAEAGVCSHFWQTYAWSRGEKSQYANIYQYKNGQTAHGIGIDLDESYGNEGWWRWSEPVAEPAPEPTYLLSVDDANKAISLLSGAYGATTDDDAKEEFHQLANALRVASGQPEEE